MQEWTNNWAEQHATHCLNNEVMHPKFNFCIYFLSPTTLFQKWLFHVSKFWTRNCSSPYEIIVAAPSRGKESHQGLWICDKMENVFGWQPNCIGQICCGGVFLYLIHWNTHIIASCRKMSCAIGHGKVWWLWCRERYDSKSRYRAAQNELCISLTWFQNGSKSIYQVTRDRIPSRILCLLPREE